MGNRVGAPKGGRVHWLLWHLPSAFKGAYVLHYNYAEHNYIFERRQGKQLYDVFIIRQTSAHYWKVCYACAPLQIYEFFGYKNTRIIAERMVEIWRETSNGVEV